MKAPLWLLILSAVAFPLLLPKTTYFQDNNGFITLEVRVNASNCSGYSVVANISNTTYDLDGNGCVFTKSINLSVGEHFVIFNLLENGSLLESKNVTIIIYPNVSWEVLSPSNFTFSLGDRVLWEIEFSRPPDKVTVVFENQSLDAWQSLSGVWKWWFDTELPDGSYAIMVFASWDNVSLNISLPFNVSNEGVLKVIYPETFQKAGNILFEIQFVENGKVWVEVFENETMIKNESLPYTFKVYKKLIPLEKGLYKVHFVGVYKGVKIDKWKWLAVETELPKPNITIDILYPIQGEVYYPGELQARVRILLNGSPPENASVYGFVDKNQVNCTLERDYVCNLGFLDEGLHTFEIFVEYNGSYFKDNVSFVVSSRRINVVCRTDVLNFTIKKGQPIEIFFDIYDEKMRFTEPDKVEAKIIDTKGKVFWTSLDRLKNGMYRLRFYPSSEGIYRFMVKGKKAGYITGVYEGNFSVKFQKEAWQTYFELPFLIKVLAVLGIVLLIVAILKVIL